MLHDKIWLIIKKRNLHMARREAFKMYLKKGFEKEYEWRHRNIWPEVKAKIEASGVYDYSI